MKKGILALFLLFLLTLASQCSWCAAERSAGLSAGHRLRPHLQIQEELQGTKDLEIQSPSRRLGFGHEVSTVEMKHHRRMVTGHKGGSMGGGAGAGGAAAGAGGRTVGGGGAVTRPHNNKNGAAALPVPVASVLALALACGVALSAFSF
ncbi:uncharacterized protein LOC120711986 [Panicum virgatum]|uniref:Uncharacterized protein n=1 Tax=Panicum virgatum TaxID=38727 RepID=A0A8T0RCQ7_PANVG|nr:uncharacterized protein LOC120711986 [Panicum virgatum]KAG2582908.1 hypothetical protein PVAP13_6KG157300 [Panicum virgatum]